MFEMYLFKIMKVLVDVNFIKMICGWNGGVMFVWLVGDIMVGEVVCVVEESFFLVECFDFGCKDCFLILFCGFNGLLYEVFEVFMEVFDIKLIVDFLEDWFGMCNFLKIDFVDYLMVVNV